MFSPLKFPLNLLFAHIKKMPVGFASPVSKYAFLDVIPRGVFDTKLGSSEESCQFCTELQSAEPQGPGAV